MSYASTPPAVTPSHAFVRAARRVQDGLLRMLVAARCAGCDVRLSADRGWCSSCRAQLSPLTVRLPPIEPDEDVPLQLHAAGAFTGGLAQAVHRFKYRGRTDLAAVLAEAMVPAFPASHQWDALVPVPLHPRRLAARGYNQAGLLAGVLGRRLGVAVEHDWLFRRVLTAPQATLDREARLSNVQRAFHVRGDAGPRRRVLLVDDVATTGATAMACAAALRSAGVRELQLLVIALADRDVEQNQYATQPQHAMPR